MLNKQNFDGFTDFSQFSQLVYLPINNPNCEVQASGEIKTLVPLTNEPSSFQLKCLIADIAIENENPVDKAGEFTITIEAKLGK